VVVRVVVMIGLTSLVVVVVVVTLALMALRSSCRTYASARLTVGVGLDQHVALVAKVLAILSCGLHLRRSSHFFTTNSLITIHCFSSSVFSNQVGWSGSVAGSCETYERRAVSFQQLFQWDRNRCSAVANGCSDLLLGFGPADFDGIDALLWAAGSQLSRMSTALGSASAVAGLELLSGRRELGPRLLGVGGGVRSVLEK